MVVWKQSVGATCSGCVNSALLACAPCHVQLFSSISFVALGRLLGVSPERAETLAGKMVGVARQCASAASHPVELSQSHVNNRTSTRVNPDRGKAPRCNARWCRWLRRLRRAGA